MRALITGATSGIGLALAERIAKEGHDLFLVARNGEQLETVARHLSQRHGVDVRVFMADLADPAAIQGIAADIETSGVAIDILVNNAGFGYFGATARNGFAIESALIQLQITAATELIHACLGPMLARRSGRILNVASVYSFAPVPYQAAYSACKAFLFTYSAALAEELRDSGVTVSVLAPGSTRTAFRRGARLPGNSAEHGMSAEVVAAQGFEGMMRGRLLIVPGFWNKVFVGLLTRLPRGTLAPLMKRINRARGLGATYTNGIDRPA